MTEGKKTTEWKAFLWVLGASLTAALGAALAEALGAGLFPSGSVTYIAMTALAAIAAAAAKYMDSRKLVKAAESGKEAAALANPPTSSGG